MESIREIFKIGHGPSSSHTMGPKKAAQQFLEKNTNAESVRVTLYGSLAATGRGHLTDKAILDVFKGKTCDIIWLPDQFLPRHPNAMLFEAFIRTTGCLIHGSPTASEAGQLSMILHKKRQNGFIHTER
jgi:L-serine dehydratase